MVESTAAPGQPYEKAQQAESKNQILQVQKKSGGPWTEVAIVGAHADALGDAMLHGKMAIAFRVLEVVASGRRA